MNVVFTKSANGEATCNYNSIRLHSAYNPGQEALRFVQSVKCNFKPNYIIVTGPALSYTAVYLKEEFPYAKVIGIHYCDDFKMTDKLWDNTFYYSKSSAVTLSEQLFSYLGEDGIVSSLFISWKPSEKAFPDEYKNVWLEIRSAIIKSRNVLATRSFFAKRWVKNTIRFSLFVNETCYFQKGTSPILVCASGPSLKTSLPYIKTYREKFFLIAVSSAMSPLLYNGIIPDLCVSCDGGFWAKKHISYTLKAHPEIPLALSPESAVFQSILKHSSIVPLSYGDGISEDFFKEFQISGTRAYRNGTVSGTAAQLALSLTNGNVYFCGLDLASSKGYAHTQPNELEKTNELYDCRLVTKETRITPSTFKSPSLVIYQNWFASSSFGNRLFRLSDHFLFSNKLREVKDVDWEYFCKTETNEKTIKPMKFSSTRKISYEKRREKINKLIEEKINTPSWISEAVPADYIVYQRSIGMDSEVTVLKKLQADIAAFKKDILRSF